MSITNGKIANPIVARDNRISRTTWLHQSKLDEVASLVSQGRRDIGAASRLMHTYPELGLESVSAPEIIALEVLTKVAGVVHDAPHRYGNGCGALDCVERVALDELIADGR